MAEEERISQEEVVKATAQEVDEQEKSVKATHVHESEEAFPKLDGKWQKVGLWTGGVALVVAVMSAAYALGTQQGRIADSNTTPTPTPLATALPVSTASPTVTATPDTSITPVSDADVTWLGTPQKVSDLKLFTNLASYYQGESASEIVDNITYYKVGTYKGLALYLVTVAPNDPSGNLGLYVTQTDATHYTLLTKVGDGSRGEGGGYTGPDLVSTVAKDTTTTFNSIADQSSLLVNGATLTEANLYGTTIMATLDTSVTVGDLVATTKYGPLYTATYQNSGAPGDITLTGITQQAFLLKRPDGTVTFYRYDLPFLADSDVPFITWTDGTTNKDAYKVSGFGGCGSAIYSMTLTQSDLSNLPQIGTTKSGDPIYTFASASDAVFQSLFNFYFPDGTYYDNNTGKPITITKADYLAKHGVILYKDPYNRLTVLIDETFGQAAECGKPVVYLYPTHTENVSVEVGADITKSEPAYTNGWNVTAQPNGTLTATDGKQYHSLFWEGLGKGAYPVITNGFVVKQADLKFTMETQLAQLGLNAKESADFMAFWLPKMPTTPYVRLTWFGTQQLNNLAPLTITPKPDTLIRIFLDFEGLQQPISLPVEHLSSIPRIGFTAVEWGGLLQNQ